MTKEDLQQISALLDAKLEPIQTQMNQFGARLDRLEEDVAAIREDTEITRGAVNSLIEWADNVAVITQIKFPVERSKAE